MIDARVARTGVTAVARPLDRLDEVTTQPLDGTVAAAVALAARPLPGTETVDEAG